MWRIPTRIAGLLIAVAALSSAAVAYADDPREAALTADLFLKGGSLSDAAASRLEADLKSNSKDLKARSLLLAFYNQRRYTEPVGHSKFHRHLLWLIMNRPDAPILGTVFYLDPRTHPVGYRTAKRAWLEQTRRRSKDPAVLDNAASFFNIDGPSTAERLLKQGEALEPRNPRWSDRLGHLYALGLSDLVGAARVKAASQSLAAYERALKLSSDRFSRRGALIDAARVAVDAGALDKARSYAEEGLKTADDGFPSGLDGNTLHYGHTVLGRVALRQGDLAQASKHLLEAGRTPGSPNLGSFGPNMMLAKELLEKGERESVLEYFQLCKRFWKSASLDKWAAQVTAGKTPDLRPNLSY